MANKKRTKKPVLPTLDDELGPLTFDPFPPGCGKAMYERLAKERKERKYAPWNKLDENTKMIWDVGTEDVPGPIAFQPPQWWRMGEPTPAGCVEEGWFHGNEFDYAKNLLLRDKLIAERHTPREANARITSVDGSDEYIAKVITDLCEPYCIGCGVHAQTKADEEQVISRDTEIAKLHERIDSLEQRLAEALGGNFVLEPGFINDGDIVGWNNGNGKQHSKSKRATGRRARS